MNKYATHLPILEAIYDVFKFQKVFEFGCGYYSTSFFVEHCNEIESVEMQHKMWYDEISENIKSEKLKLYCLLGEVDAIELLKTKGKYDLILIDGIARANSIMESFKHTDLIVVHDTSKRAVRRYSQQISMPLGWEFKNFTKYRPHTGFYTNNKELLSLCLQ